MNNPQAGDPNTDITCKKTGNKKTIQGYACEEYVCIDQDRNRRSEVWVTTQLPIDMTRAGARSPMGAYAMGGDMPGAMMAGKFYKNDVLESSMEVTELNAKANYTITIADYKMGMQ